MKKTLELIFAGILGLASIAGGCAPSKLQQQTQQQKEIQRLPLETRLLELMEAPEDFDLAEAAFIASGVKDEAELNEYLTKFEKIVKGAAENPAVQAAENDKEKVYAIFSYLWNSAHPTRYKKDENKLTKVIDNQINGKVPVSNCMGLTVLMDAVCQRMGIEIKSVRTFKHIYSAMEYNGKIIYIENTQKEGFDIPAKERKLMENKDLLINMIRNIASTYLSKNKRKEAFSAFLTGAKMDPEEADLFYLTQVARTEFGPEKEREIMEDLHQRFPNSLRVKQYLSFALEGYNPKKALELYKEVYPTWHYRNAFDVYKMGIMHTAAEEYKEALPFLEEALEMDPNNSAYISKWYEVKRKVDKDFDRKRKEELNKRLEEARKR